MLKVHYPKSKQQEVSTSSKEIVDRKLFDFVEHNKRQQVNQYLEEGVYSVSRFRILNISYLHDNKMIYGFRLLKNAVDL